MFKPTKTYRTWLQQLKERIRSSQIKAALKVNTELLNLYWDLGKEIIDKEKNAEWGDKLIPQLSKDLLAEFPEMKGFSVTNLFYIKRWYLFYKQHNTTGPQLGAQIMPQVVAQLPNSEKMPQLVAQLEDTSQEQQLLSLFVPQLVGQIPWGHHREIITKCKNINEALFYIAETTKNNWSRAVLVLQMETGLYKRKGKALSNFETTLPKPQSDLAKELLKNPYNLGFLSLSEQANEKELEDALINHLIKFLLELGNGFAFIGRQYLVKVEEQEFYIDLLFYHTRLHAYIIVELKIDEFKPEYAGKLNFYLSVIDDQLKTKEDQPSIGLLLCKKAGKMVVEYSLKNISKPIGVSEYELTEKIPAALKGKLPTIKQIEKELNDFY